MKNMEKAHVLFMAQQGFILGLLNFQAHTLLSKTKNRGKKLVIERKPQEAGNYTKRQSREVIVMEHKIHLRASWKARKEGQDSQQT